jgi:hypothetical protein
MASESDDHSNGLPVHAPPLPSSRRASLQPPPHMPTGADSADSGLPMRHPRPLTAAEIHLELEQEQEAIVSNFPTFNPGHTQQILTTTSRSTG